MDKNEKIKLEEELDGKGYGYNEIVDYALDNGLYYESALLVLSGKITLTEAIEADKMAVLAESAELGDAIPDDKIMDACAECVKIAEERK